MKSTTNFGFICVSTINLIGGVNMMDSIFKTINGFVALLTGLVMSLLGLAILGELLFGDFLGLTVVDNITMLVSDLANGGVVGLIVIAVILMLLKK